MTRKQIAALSYIARNPGCCVMDVNRYEWTGRGHSATYLRIGRLVKAGLVKSTAGVGNACALTLTPRGGAVVAS